MADKRSVDELSIAELERILAIKKRQARQQQMQRMKRSGRIVSDSSAPKVTPPIQQPAIPPAQTPTSAIPAKDDAPFALPIDPTTTTTDPTSATTSPPHIQAKTTVPPIRGTPRFEDDVDEIDSILRRDRDDVWRIFVNRFLFLIEVAAVVGLVFLGVQLVNSTNALNDETSAAQELANNQRLASVPTIEPTPTVGLNDVVLPTGHVYSANPIFNFDEVPEHLRPRIESEVYRPQIARPEPTDETPFQILIPSLNIEQTIIQGTDWEALRLGVGQVQNGATIGQTGNNVVLAAHNDIYGEIFRHLDELQAGEQFQIRTVSGRTYTYEITGSDIVNPDAVEVMQHQAGQATATLISCYPYQVNDRRIIIFANLVSST